MKTSAIILALSWLTPPVGALWDAPVGGRSLLGRAVRNCLDSGVIDELCILTDDAGLLCRGHGLGARVFSCPEAWRNHPFNHLNIELQHLYREFDLTLEADIQADLTFFVPWNMPLLDGRVLERLYHRLLDDPLAARVIPMAPIDPQLFARMDGAEGFFPVWGQKGLDRQLIQQLYRVGYACLVHWNRLLAGIPKVVGLPLDTIRLFTVQGPEDVPLAEALHAYAGQQPRDPW